jgi:hypothetical protein
LNAICSIVYILDNLDGSQYTALKDSWKTLMKTIGSLTSLPADCIVDSDYGNELFCMIAYDNPDILLFRWLRAYNWDIKVTVQQIIEILKWRMKWGVQTLLAKGESDVSIDEIITSKGYFMGHDKEGHPICYIHVKEHIKGQFPRENSEKLAVLALETCRQLLKTPTEPITVVVDMAGFGWKNIDFQLAKFFIDIIQKQYPELLAHGIVLNSSLIFNSCWAAVKPWLDPTVESKVCFMKNEADLTTYIDASNIPKRLNGIHPDFQYIPLTTEEKTILAAFRADKQGKANAQEAHRKAARNFLHITLQWTENDDNHSLLSERAKVIKQLRDAFENLVPYIRTRTHYHRSGDIDEPIFNIAYNKLRATDEDIVYS